MANNDYGYGANNPEPQEMKDSAVVRNKNKDALHSSAEYIEGTSSAVSEDNKPKLPCKNSLPS